MIIINGQCLKGNGLNKKMDISVSSISYNHNLLKLNHDK